MTMRRRTHFPVEEWRQSISLPDYDVSSFGRVRRRPYYAPMPNGGFRLYGGEPHYGQDARKDKRLVFTYKGKTYKVARIVCEAFNGPEPFKGADCMHDDENYTNNTPGNLKWGTRKENLNYPGFLHKCELSAHRKFRHAPFY